MSLQKTVLFCAVALALSACGSGGGGEPHLSAQSTDNINNEKNFNLSALKEQWNEALAKDFQQYGFKGIDSYEVSIGGKTYRGNHLDINLLGKGLQRLPLTEKVTATVRGQQYTATSRQTIHLYQQNYSIIGGSQVHGGSISGGEGIYRLNQSYGGIDADIDTLKGQATQALPSTGVYHYSGAAFTQNEQGKLDYRVDFDKLTGSGSITGIGQAGNITLNEGKIGKLSHTNPDQSFIAGHGITGNAQSERQGSGTYKLGFFGPNAEEIAGAVEQNGQGLVGFGGTKQ